MPSVGHQAARSAYEALREAVALHARTLDDWSLWGDPLDRDDVDNALYNVVRAQDPEWWDRKVPGLMRSDEDETVGTSEIQVQVDADSGAA